MSSEPTPTPREQIEIRLTALLMGELAAEETVALHALLAADPELAKLHARLRQAMELLREATAEPEPATPTPARLSGERRERLLAHFQRPAPQPAKPAPIIKAPRRNWSWVVQLGAAAAVVFFLAGLFFPSISAVKESARRSASIDATSDFSTESAATAKPRESERKNGLGESSEAPQDRPIAQLSSEPRFGVSSAYAVTKSGTGTVVLAPAGKLQASALYLPAPPPPAEEPPAPILGDIPLAGRLFTSTAPSSAPQSGEKNDERSVQDRASGGWSGLGGANTYNGGTVVGAGTLALNGPTDGRRNVSGGYRYDDSGGADTDGDKGKKQNHAPAFPVTPPLAVLEKGASDGDHRLPVAEPQPAADFDGVINFGSPIPKAPADPAAPGVGSAAPGTRSGDPATVEVVREFSDYNKIDSPQKQAAQTGKKGGILRGLETPPAVEAKPATGPASDVTIAVKDVEIRQGNREELKFEDFKSGETTQTPLGTASEGTPRDETGKRGAATKVEGEKDRFFDSRDESEFNLRGSGPADKNGMESDGKRERQTAPAPMSRATPMPSSSTSKLDPRGPAGAKSQQEVALPPHDADVLFKKVDEMAESDREGRAKKGKAGPAAEQFARRTDELLKVPADPQKPKEKLAEANKIQDDETPAARPAQPAAIPQPEVATSANAFSTFSLNVSDVSFKLAGASLEKGQMPELATVRSEEFINAFDYRDPEPAAGAPLAFATERARYPFAQNRDLVRFSVKTAAAGRQPGRPLNLVLLLDNSGSMERADRVRILREALRVLAAQLQPQDRLSVVTFARTPRLWADGVTGDQAGAAVARVGEITPQGGTNLEAALDLGYATALKHYQPGGISRVILLTDGAANLGDVNPDALKRKVETNRQRGVALDCFGIGWEGYDDTVLETLARNGDGRYGYINSPEEAASGFAAQLAGALRVAASDVKVQVEWNPRRVTAYRQIGYAKHQLKKEQFRDNTVDAAEIGAAESGNALYVVEVNPRGEGDLATVRVRFKVPGTADYKEHEWAVPFTPNASSLEQASPALRLAGTASAFSEWLVASPYAAEVTTDRLLGLLNGVPAIYPADPRPKKLEWMIRTAKSVSGR